MCPYVVVQCHVTQGRAEAHLGSPLNLSHLKAETASGARWQVLSVPVRPADTCSFARMPRVKSTKPSSPDRQQQPPAAFRGRFPLSHGHPFSFTPAIHGPSLCWGKSCAWGARPGLGAELSLCAHLGLATSPLQPDTHRGASGWQRPRKFRGQRGGDKACCPQGPGAEFRGWPGLANPSTLETARHRHPVTKRVATSVPHPQDTDLSSCSSRVCTYLYKPNADSCSLNNRTRTFNMDAVGYRNCSEGCL